MHLRAMGVTVEESRFATVHEVEVTFSRNTMTMRNSAVYPSIRVASVTTKTRCLQYIYSCAAFECFGHSLSFTTFDFYLQPRSTMSTEEGFSPKDERNMEDKSEKTAITAIDATAGEQLAPASFTDMFR